MQRTNKTLRKRLDAVAKLHDPTPMSHEEKMEMLAENVKMIEKKCGPDDGSLLSRLVHAQTKEEADKIWEEMQGVASTPKVHGRYGPYGDGVRRLFEEVARFHGYQPWLPALKGRDGNTTDKEK